MPWRKVRFKGDEVLARCDASGQLVSDGGRVEIRYRPRDGRSYRAGVRNLESLPDAEILPDDACAPVSAGNASRPRVNAVGMLPLRRGA